MTMVIRNFPCFVLLFIETYASRVNFDCIVQFAVAWGPQRLKRGTRCV